MQESNKFVCLGCGRTSPNIALKRLFDTAIINDVTDTDDVNDDYDDDYDDDDDDERGPPCSEHTGEFKNMFCENGTCRITICPACLIKSHNGHCIKTRREFIKEQENSVRELGKHCQKRKESILAKINLVENRRAEVTNIMQNRKEEIEKAYKEKLSLLKNNMESLVERLCSLEQAI